MPNPSEFWTHTQDYPPALEHTRQAALAFVRKTLSPDTQYRPIHLTEETLVDLLTRFRDQEKW